jgi:hypothetical protein
VWRALTPVDDAVVSASGFGSWENDGAKPEFFKKIHLKFNARRHALGFDQVASCRLAGVGCKFDVYFSVKTLKMN